MLVQNTGMARRFGDGGGFTAESYLKRENNKKWI